MSEELNIGDRVCIKLKNKPKGTVTRVFEDEHPFQQQAILRTYLVQCDDVKYSGFYNRHSLKRLIKKSKLELIQLKVGYVYESRSGKKYLIFEKWLSNKDYLYKACNFNCEPYDSSIWSWNQNGRILNDGTKSISDLIKEIGPWDPQQEY